MIVMPLASNKARPDLIDRHIRAVKINPIAAFVFTFSMAFVVKGSHANCPKTRRSEHGADKRGPANEKKNSKPKAPIQDDAQDCAAGINDRAIFFILYISIWVYAGMVH